MFIRDTNYEFESQVKYWLSRFISQLKQELHANKQTGQKAIDYKCNVMYVKYNFLH